MHVAVYNNGVCGCRRCFICNNPCTLCTYRLQIKHSGQRCREAFQCLSTLARPPLGRQLGARAVDGARAFVGQRLELLQALRPAIHRKRFLERKRRRCSGIVQARDSHRAFQRRHRLPQPLHQPSRRARRGGDARGGRLHHRQAADVHHPPLHGVAQLLGGCASGLAHFGKQRAQGLQRAGGQRVNAVVDDLGGMCIVV